MSPSFPAGMDSKWTVNRGEEGRFSFRAGDRRTLTDWRSINTTKITEV